MAYRTAPIKRESVITRAAEEIRRLIQQENLKPDDPLPAETQLSQMLGISRNSVREALRMLDGLGFVEKRPGRRVVVKSPSGSRAQRAFDRTSLADAVQVAYRARLAIEEKCAELSAQAPAEAALADLESQLSLFREALKRRDFAAAAQAHEGFHSALVAAAGNPALSSMFEPIRGIVAEISHQGQGTFKRARPVALHVAILDAIRAGDPRAAAQAVRRHFKAVVPLVEFISKHPRPGRGADPAAQA